ncbi:hypothetical protein V1508DRAFT_405264 [Lipomyces doorenjongii]|uniref:uncharacterized protein n=1 Tax=Lipomyces doorenjongii TaxID=383834 RepID=UPI0034CF4723
MVTRGKRIDYFISNDGNDEEAPLEDRLDSSHHHDSGDSFPDSEIFPSESASAVESSQEIPDDAALTAQPQSSRDIELSKSESKSRQCWDYFDITEVNRSWILKTYGRRSITELDKQYGSGTARASKEPKSSILTYIAFRQIFHDIPGITLSFMSRSVLRQRLVDDFAAQLIAHLQNNSSFSLRVD